MRPKPKLSAPAEIQAALDTLPSWQLDAGTLLCTLVFDDFSSAFGFMTRAALLAERADHHPDWRNVWNRVEIRLSTHEAGGITQRDLDLARALEKLSERCTPRG